MKHAMNIVMTAMIMIFALVDSAGAAGKKSIKQQKEDCGFAQGDCEGDCPVVSGFGDDLFKKTSQNRRNVCMEGCKDAALKCYKNIERKGAAGGIKGSDQPVLSTD